FTPASLSALPELPMAIAPKSRPNKNQMAEYFNRYAEHFDLPVHVNEAVLEIRKEDECFLDITSIREYTADEVIHAAGFCDKPYLPEWAIELTIPYIHSSEYKTPVSVKGERVLLVGTGNSAAQIGAELTKHFVVDWSTNRKPKFSALNVFG